MKTILFIAAALVLTCIPGLAKEPSTDVSPKLHPNLNAAEVLMGQAYGKITLAQQSNEWDDKGHAERAKQLIEEVIRELKLSEESSIRSRLDFDIEDQR